MRLWTPASLSAFAMRAAILVAASRCSTIVAQDVQAAKSAVDVVHQTGEWASIAAHLPDRATASPQALETQADLLRVRRYPDDAVEFYHAAIDRGGDRRNLLNKIGMTELSVGKTVLARAYFEQVVKLDRKYADGWNNLGSVEYIAGKPSDAIPAYKRAIKLQRRNAIFHSNLGTAYYADKSYSSGRREIALALRLDPAVFDPDRTGWSATAHVLSSGDRARIALEMAKLYARKGSQTQMLRSLAMASEAGMDVQREMRKDAALAPFASDPRVFVLVHNAQVLRATGVSESASGPPEAAPDAKPVSE